MQIINRREANPYWLIGNELIPLGPALTEDKKDAICLQPLFSQLIQYTSCILNVRISVLYCNIQYLNFKKHAVD